MDEDEITKVLGRLVPKSGPTVTEIMLDILANTEPPQLQRTRTSTTREDALSVAIQAARAAMKARLKREPKAAEVIQYLESEASPEGTVDDYEDGAILWADASGKLRTTKHKTIQNRLTAIRKRS